LRPAIKGPPDRLKARIGARPNRRSGGSMARAASTSGRRVLIVEDNAMITALVAEGLEEHGYECAACFGRGADALAWLETDTPDLAILDLGLTDGICTPLARELDRRGVPFVGFTGYAKRPDTPPEFAAAPWISKPSLVESLVQALAAVRPGRSSARRRPS
jgi:DNA-binding response OmpR family regulator